MVFFGVLLSLFQSGNLVPVEGGLLVVLVVNGLLLVSFGRVNLVLNHVRVGRLQGQVLAGAGFV